MPQLIAINTEHAGVLNMVFKYSFNQNGKERQVLTSILVAISSKKKTEIIVDSGLWKTFIFIFKSGWIRLKGFLRFYDKNRTISRCVLEWETGLCTTLELQSSGAASPRANSK